MQEQEMGTDLELVFGRFCFWMIEAHRLRRSVGPALMEAADYYTADGINSDRMHASVRPRRCGLKRPGTDVDH